MPIKNKINYEKQEDLLEVWLETEQDFKPTRHQAYRGYLQKLAQKYPEFNNPTNQLIMSYTNFINFITKNAVVATVIMILAVGGASTAAAQFFAPQEYKPSTLLNLTNKEAKKAEEVKVTNFEECANQTGKVLESYPRQCVWEGQTFVEEISEAVEPTDPEDSGQYSNTLYKECKHINPNFSMQIPTDWSCNARDDIIAPNYTLEISPQEKNFQITISNLGRGPSCMGDTCKSEIFYENNNCRLSYMRINNELIEIGGFCPILNTDTYSSNWVSIYHKSSPNSSEPTEEQKVKIKKIIDTLVVGSHQVTTQTKTYTNSYFTDLKIDYASDWKMKVSEAKDRIDNYDCRSVELLFQKADITLKYYVSDLCGGIGKLGPSCTNNDNLYLEAGNGWWRIRNKDGSRTYSNNLKTNITLKQEDVTWSDQSLDPKISQEWALTPPIGQTYKACDFSGLLLTSSPNLPTPPGQGQYGIIRISLEGLNSNNQAIAKQADQIVASTKF